MKMICKPNEQVVKFVQTLAENFNGTAFPNNSISVASDTGGITTGSDSIANSLNKSAVNSEKLPEILDGKYFEVTKKDKDGHVEAKCVECFKTGRVQKYQGSPMFSNFTTHLKRKHPAALQSYTEYMKTAEAKAKRVKQTCLPFPVINTTSHLQSKTERLILNFVVQTMQPLSIVDDEAFKKLVTGLNSEAKVMCRQTLTKMVSTEYQSRFSALKKTLAEVDWMCATADIWASRHRKDLKRKSAILALQRFQGVHSNDKIAEMLCKIFESFDVSNKIVNVITDNGSNFVKAFKVYSIDAAIQRVEDDGNEMEQESDEDKDIREVDFPELEDTGIVLPPHLRCASHTLNLIMTQNLEKVTKGREKAKTQFKKLLRDSFSKCHAVWNKVGRSVKSSELVRNLLGKNLIRPVATRWNSTFDAVTRLLEFRDKLDAMFEVLGVTKLNPLEVSSRI
ncbi:Zinc finger BED domain-containing protein 1 [Orchesella cincta]|uniref:Zinc finger BED domain-containing protein 1 n=1 Tax=Orchesella cincta TaxID=48709 RepID=A0A1D2M2Y7_ORCCI|nr:Zinc finger BED domain-containing protein 1 [Orchesella cincta]